MRKLANDFRHEDTLPRRPHNVAPSGLGSVRLINVVHRFQTPMAGTSDAGLAVTLNGTMRTLRQAGVHCESWNVRSVEELFTKLEADEWRSNRKITHVVINTPNFTTPEKFAELAARWIDTEFVMLNHTGLAYLSIDQHGQGVQRTRKLLDLQTATHNIKVAGNNIRYVRMFQDAYGHVVVYLPNLYDITSFREPVISRKDPDPLRIGSFGVGRPWKNQLVAAQAALSMARRSGVRLELHYNVDPWKSNQDLVSCRNELFANTHHTLIAKNWNWWPHFRQLVSGMDLLLNPSFDETHCCVCADGIAEGVPGVVTAAMEWCPRSWQVSEPHDPANIAAVGMTLLHNRIGAIHDGRTALRGYVSAGIKTWIDYLCKE
jgi:hypothetical protein